MKVKYYTKYGCHLCDEGLSILRQFPEIGVEIVDVEENPEKYGDYLLRIPVISFEQGRKELGWPFTEEAIRETVAGLKF